MADRVWTLADVANQVQGQLPLGAVKYLWTSETPFVAVIHTEDRDAVREILKKHNHLTVVILHPGEVFIGPGQVPVALVRHE